MFACYDLPQVLNSEIVGAVKMKSFLSGPCTKRAGVWARGFEWGFRGLFRPFVWPMIDALVPLSLPRCLC